MIDFCGKGARWRCSLFAFVKLTIYTIKIIFFVEYIAC